MSAQRLAGRSAARIADPTAFAIAARQAASAKNATVLTAHTAREIICLVSVAAPDRLSAMAVLQVG